MRDYVLGFDGGPKKLIALWPTKDLQKALRDIKRGDVGNRSGQCTDEQMIARIEIELTWRSLARKSA